MSSRSSNPYYVSMCIVAVAVLFLVSQATIHAQQRGRGQQPGASARQAAVVDLTGTWVAMVTEDWHLRMVTPKKGDYSGIPLNQAARRVADSWDPAKDEAAGEACKAYAAPAIMRVPTRLKISWDNDNTLKMETDAGTQTRLFHFDQSKPAGPASWQGFSTAKWEKKGGQFGVPPGGFLTAETTNLRPGYLRKNGVPFSADTKVTDHFYRVQEPNGDSLLMVITFVDDPQYLARPLAMNQQFKKVADGSGWNPTPCDAR